MKKAIIFDFDDTLIYTNEIFDRAKNCFYQLMEEWCLGDERVAEVLNRIDVANVKKAGGLVSDCFPNALRQTYLYYCREKGQQADGVKADLCADLGWQVFEQQAVLMPGAVDLLETVSRYYNLFLLTQGDQDVQQRRLEKSNLLPYFADYKIVKAKKQQHFLQLINEYDLDVTFSWSVGNSVRSDINLAVLAGLQAIHVQIDCWDYETATSIGNYHKVSDLRACETILMEGIEV